MEFCVDTNKNNSWYVGTKNYDSKMINKIETIMFQGNGYVGMRGVTEEPQLNEKRDMFVSGTFDAFPSEVTELPNLPDLLNMVFQVDGQTLNLKDGQVKGYHKYLDMKNGELTREFTWIINHKQINFKFTRFVSMDNYHLLASKVTVSADKNIDLKIKSGIDGQQSNSGTQHLMEGSKRFYEGKFIQLTEKSQQSKIEFVFNSMHKLFVNEVLLNDKPYIKMGRRQIFENYDVDLAAGQVFQIVKYSNVFTSIDKDVKDDDLAETSVNCLKKSSWANYHELLQKSARAWDKKIWKKSFVEIKSKDIEPQVAINFARYQLAANTPHSPNMNIGAKGLTGEGYKGHTFWDTEIFMLPYFIFTMPKIARNLLEYRYLGLEGAHKKAIRNGYRGAEFPWEAACPSDGETAPLWGSADIVTGEPMKVWSGFIEQHITGDVVYAVMEYLNATNDRDFAKKMGYEIILDAAKFWVSRLEYDQDHERYEITNVIGPDEYKEHADNNAYTNYLAHWCIQKAIQVVNILKEDHPDLYVTLDKKLDLAEAYNDWISRVNKIYLPRPNKQGVIPQDDKYLSKKKIDVTKYQINDQISEIFKDYNLDQVNNLQVTKQADVMLLINLFDDYFDKDVKLANWNYYEPKTTHESSLSMPPHSMIANELGLDDQAYKFYRWTCETDMGVHVGKSIQGMHLASCGGIWSMTVQGFGGVRISNGKLRIDPHLPKAWSSLKYRICWHGSIVKVSITHDEMEVEVVGDGIEFINNGQEYQVPDNSKIEVDDFVPEKVKR